MMETPFIAFVLAVIAGNMNGYTYYAAEIFSTVQSGNIILLGQTIAQKNWSHLAAIALTVLSFGLGSVFTSIVEGLIAGNHKKNWSTIILAIEAIMLIALAYILSRDLIQTTYACVIISFIAGMQGNAFHKVNGMLYGNVAVTLVVQLAFSNLTQSLLGQKDSGKTSSIFFFVLLGFAFGGLIGTLLTAQYQELSLLLPSALLIALAIRTYIKGDVEHKVIDPT